MTYALLAGAGTLLLVGYVVVVRQLITLGRSVAVLTHTVIAASDLAHEDARSVLGALIVIGNNQTAPRCEMPGCPNWAEEHIIELNPPDGPDNHHYVCHVHDRWGDESKHYTFIRSGVIPDPLDMDSIDVALERYMPGEGSAERA
jgi:hypothetical protein